MSMTKFANPSAVLTPERGWSVVTGAALIVMAVAGAIAYGYAHPLLHMANDAQATAAAVEGRPILLAMVVLSWSLVALLDFLASCGIYLVFRRSAPLLSLLVAAIRVVYTLVLIAAVAELGSLLFNEYSVSGLVKFDSFEKIWSGGLIVFGLHLLALSRLVSVVGFPSLLVATFLGLGGLGYVFVKGTDFLGLEGLTVPLVVEVSAGIPMVFGELLFAIALLVGAAAPGKASSDIR